MRSTLLAASLLLMSMATANAADLTGTFYDIINFGYKYLPDPPWLGLVDVIFG